MLAWIIVLMVLGTSATIYFLWSRKRPQGHPKAGKPYCYTQFALLAFSATCFIAVAGFTPLGTVYSVVFWLLWGIGLTVVFATANHSVKTGVVASMVTSIAGVALLLVSVLSFALTSSSSSQAQEMISVKMPDGSVVSMEHVSNPALVSATSPLVGEAAVNNATAPPTLRDGKGAITSYSNLQERVNVLSQEAKDTYIKEFDQYGLHGNWEKDVPQYVEWEKNEGSEFRGILVMNSPSTTVQQARDAMRPKMGNAVDKMDVEYGTGALVNTRGIGTDDIETFGDGRSQIRGLLTVPMWDEQQHKHVANRDMLKAGIGILVECTNMTAGIVSQPHVYTSQKPKPAQAAGSTSSTPGTPGSSTVVSTTPSIPTTTTSPRTETTTTVPSTPTTETTTSTSSTTTTTETTSSTPSTTTTTATTTPTSTTTQSTTSTTTSTPVCEYNPKLPPDCKDPSDSFPGPSEHPTASSPPSSVEDTAPEETSSVSSTRVIPTQESSVAPDPSNPGTGDQNPDGPSSMSAAAAGTAGLSAVGIGFGLFLRRRKNIDA